MLEIITVKLDIRTLLHAAAYRNHYSIIEYLTTSGVDVNAVDNVS